MPTRFIERTPYDGFDPAPADTPYPAQFVPEGRPTAPASAVVLLTEPDGVTFHSPDPAVRVGPKAGWTDRRGLPVEVVSTGPADVIVEARRGGAVVARLRVFTLSHFHVPVSFHVFRDTARAARRTYAQVPQILAEMNDIWTPQTNIEFVPSQTTDFTLARNLCAFLDDDDPATVGLFANQLPRGDFHVFFVWEAGRTTRTRDIDATTWEYQFCWLDDDLAESPGKTLAHEACHFLGEMAHDTSRDSVFYRAAPTGRRIGSAMARRMHRNAVVRPGQPGLEVPF